MTDKTLEYLEKAGEQALRTGANQEAPDFLNQALRLERRRAGTATRGGRAGSGTWAKPITAWGRPAVARTILSAPCGCWAGRCRRAWPGTRPSKPRPRRRRSRSRRARWTPAPPHARSEAARAYERLAQIHYLEHELRPSLYAAARTRNLLEAEGPSPGLARGLANGGLAAALVGRHTLAETTGRAALLMAEAQEQLSSLAYVSELTGVAAAGMGQWAVARQRLHRAAEIADQLGDRRRWKRAWPTWPMWTISRGISP